MLRVSDLPARERTAWRSRDIRSAFLLPLVTPGSARIWLLAVASRRRRLPRSTVRACLTVEAQVALAPGARDSRHLSPGVHQHCDEPRGCRRGYAPKHRPGATPPGSGAAHRAGEPDGGAAPGLGPAAGGLGERLAPRGPEAPD